MNKRRAKAYCQKGTHVLSLLNIIQLVKVPLGVNERRAKAYCQKRTRVLSLQYIIQLVCVNKRRASLIAKKEPVS